MTQPTPAGASIVLPAILGPTGAGKTELAVAAASFAPVEVVSVDSVQVYRRLDIGSAKPTPAQRAAVPHHLIDVADPAERINAAQYAALARQAIDDIRQRGKIPLLVGGAGFYLRALLRPPSGGEPRQGLSAWIESLERIAPADVDRWLRRLDPVREAEIEPTDRYRRMRSLESVLSSGKPWVQSQTSGSELPQYELRPLLVWGEGEAYERRLKQRVEEMLTQGWVSEVETLLADGLPPDAPGFRTCGYRSIVRCLKQGWPVSERLVEEIRLDTRRYAKRQRTWFRPLVAPRLDWQAPDTEKLAAVRGLLDEGRPLV